MHDAIAIQLAKARVADLTRELHRERIRAEERSARSRRRLERSRSITRRGATFAPLARLLRG
jgi:hypothetical protein